MGQERPSNLGLLQIESEEVKELCNECIIDRFAHESTRKVQLRHPDIVHFHN